MMLKLTLWCSLVTSVCCFNYHGYKVLRVHTGGTKTNSISLRKDFLNEFNSKQMMLLKSSKSSVNLAVSPNQFRRVNRKLKNQKLSVSVSEKDLEQTISDNNEENNIARESYIDSLKNGYLSAPIAYLRYNEQVAWLELAAYVSPISELFKIGTSYEGREIWGITINSKKKNLPVIWLHANIHAREWISSASALYIINQIINGTCVQARYLRQNFRFYIVPNANPDGYDYTYDEDRLWRKTRSHHVDGECLGVDPNRNFDYFFGGVGTSKFPCSDIYNGPKPFSENETAAIRDYLTTLVEEGNFYLFLSLHSYTQVWLYPYSDGKEAKNDDELFELGKIAASATEAVNGAKFFTGTAPEAIDYAATGGAMDWLMYSLGVRYAYTVELRPSPDSDLGFVLPPSNIYPSGQEIFAGLAALVKAIDEKSETQLNA